MSNFIADNIRRMNRNLLIVNVVLVAIVLVAVTLSSRYLYNVVAGPFGTERAELLALKDPDTLERYFVNVSGDEILDTGIQQVTTRTRNGVKTSESVSANYLALVIEDRLLLVKAGTSMTGTQYTGALVRMPAEEQREIIDDIVSQEPRLEDVFLPYMLDTEDFRTTGYVGMLVGALLLALGVFNLFRAVRRMTAPDTHPLMRSLAAYGAPQSVAAGIDSEAGGAQVSRAGGALVTPHWLLKSAAFGMQVVALNDLAWIYKKVTQQRTNFVATGKTYAAVLWTQQGHSTEITGKQDAIDQLLQAIDERVPWVLAGFSADLDKLWKTNRPAVLKAVSDRRQQALSQAPAAEQTTTNQ
jgi:hypothetical protein